VAYKVFSRNPKQSKQSRWWGGQWGKKKKQLPRHPHDGPRQNAGTEEKKGPNEKEYERRAWVKEIQKSLKTEKNVEREKNNRGIRKNQT